MLGITADDEEAKTGEGLERIIACSDCMIGVAITLLVVDIRLSEMPRAVDSAELVAGLSAALWVTQSGQSADVDMVSADSICPAMVPRVELTC